MFWNGNTAIDGLSGSGGSVPGRGTTGPGAVAQSPDLRLRFRQGRRHQTADRGGRHIPMARMFARSWGGDRAGAEQCLEEALVGDGAALRPGLDGKAAGTDDDVVVVGPASLP